MNNKLKYSMIFGSSLVSFIFGFTNPIMLIYFTSRVDPSILAIANILSLGIGALVNNSINSDKFMNLYRKYFSYIVFMDLICCGTIYIFSVNHITFRYISIAIVSSITTSLWVIVLNNAINRNIGGDNLTKFNACIHAYELWASMFGALTYLLLSEVVADLSINHCLLVQWIALFVMGMIDMRSYKKLQEVKS